MLSETGKIKITIRPANVADAEMLADLAARTFYDAFVEANSPENMQSYMTSTFTVSKLTTELNDQRAKFLIAEVDGEPAGYAKLLDGNAPECLSGQNPIEIVRLYVDQKWLGGGVGAALMQACLDEAREAGHQTVFLGVWEHNHRAQAFYRKWGFEVVGKHVFQMGDDPQTDWWMERKLQKKS